MSRPINKLEHRSVSIHRPGDAENAPSSLRGCVFSVAGARGKLIGALGLWLSAGVVALTQLAVLGCQRSERDFSSLLRPQDDDAGANAGDAGSLPPPGASCADAMQCDDRNACNGTEACVDGRCQAGELEPDGEPCGMGPLSLLCLGGSCVMSLCGDGVVDVSREEDCDDRNSVAADGCEDDCFFSCRTDEECNNSNVCDGEETCELVSHRCESSEPLGDQTSCGPDFECNAGRCLSTACGNDALETTEQCDDGNRIDGDGCDSDCNFTCESHEDCDNLDPCDGVETCSAADHTCAPGERLICDDGNACTEDLCGPISGCFALLIDTDGDGHASSALGSCGDDCDDGDATIYAGAAELCDGLDNNCDEIPDDTAPIWYQDCDGDGFAEADAPFVQQCEIPAPSTGCPSGTAATWTTVAPRSADTQDCFDVNPNVFPRSSSPFFSQPIPGLAPDRDFDYDCAGGEEQRWTQLLSEVSASCSPLRITPILVDPILQPPVLAANAQVAEGETPRVAAQLVVTTFCIGADAWEGAVVPGCESFAGGVLPVLSKCESVNGTCTRFSEATQPECR